VSRVRREQDLEIRYTFGIAPRRPGCSMRNWSGSFRDRTEIGLHLCRCSVRIEDLSLKSPRRSDGRADRRVQSDSGGVGAGSGDPSCNLGATRTQLCDFAELLLDSLGKTDPNKIIGGKQVVLARLIDDTDHAMLIGK
jgi:hypothetical protein